MATERTFSILKPDATKRNLTGAVNAVIEEAGLRIVGQRRIQMSRAQAETFYEIHKERPFFGELVEFMTSGPVVVQVLEGAEHSKSSVVCDALLVDTNLDYFLFGLHAFAVAGQHLQDREHQILFT